MNNNTSELISNIFSSYCEQTTDSITKCLPICFQCKTTIYKNLTSTININILIKAGIKTLREHEFQMKNM